MEAVELIRKLLDILSQPQKAAQQPHAELTPVVAPQNPFPEDDHTNDETGGIMVPPLQQKMELLKKVAGVDSVYDKPGEEPDDEVSIMTRNAGLPMMTMVASEDEDGLEN